MKRPALKPVLAEASLPPDSIIHSNAKSEAVLPPVDVAAEERTRFRRLLAGRYENREYLIAARKASDLATDFQTKNALAEDILAHQRMDLTFTRLALEDPVADREAVHALYARKHDRRPLPELWGESHHYNSIQYSRRQHPEHSPLARLQARYNYRLSMLRDHARIGVALMHSAEADMQAMAEHYRTAQAERYNTSLVFLDAARRFLLHHVAFMQKNAEIETMLKIDRMNIREFVAARDAYAKERKAVPGAMPAPMPSRPPSTISYEQIDEIKERYAAAKGLWLAPIPE